MNLVTNNWTPDDLTPSEVAHDDRQAEIADAVARDEAAERLET
jgi:hypothetical protein